MTYYTGDQRRCIRADFLLLARKNLPTWSFLHSALISIVESQGGRHASGGDGFFRLPRGEFDVNTAAERLEIALEARAEWERDRAENDKSG